MTASLLRSLDPPAPSPRQGSRPVATPGFADLPPLILAGPGDPPCAVADFQRRLTDAMSAEAPRTLILDHDRGGPAAIWNAVGASRGVVASFPVVAWKRLLLKPLLALAAARLRRRSAVVVLHEWGALHHLRRWALLPALAAASRLVVLSPHVRAEIAADPLAKVFLGKAVIAPMPPNLAAPQATASSPLARRLAAARREGRLVLGHFGSIYAAKNPEAMLAVAAALKARGARPLLVYAGAFVRSTDGVEDAFAARVRDLGLADDILVSGYVADDAELYGLFAEMDAFAYVFPEGMTARRSSVLASVQSGRPVVVTAPARADEFDHHPRLAALIEGGALHLVPGGATAEDYAEAVLAVARRETRPVRIDLDAWWGDLADTVRPLM